MLRTTSTGMAAINGAIRDLQDMPPLALTDVQIAQGPVRQLASDLIAGGAAR
jgi:hypothetical protein